MVRESLNNAAIKAGRSAEDVELMAVSKTKPLAMLMEAYEAGQRVFGENRVPEAHDKAVQLPSDVRLEMIGHLQSNKLNTAVETFSCIQTLDSVKLAEKLESRCLSTNRKMDVLLQLKTSDEISKTGLTSFEMLLETVQVLSAMSCLSIRGLMTIAPFSDDEVVVRKAFAHCREARDKLAAQFPEQDFSRLSMGMTSDFEWAVQEGSTQVRIGSAIFGVRS